jgi:hypothetical protein
MLNLTAYMLRSMINIWLISEEDCLVNYVNYVIMTRSELYLYFTHISITKILGTSLYIMIPSSAVRFRDII